MKKLILSGLAAIVGSVAISHYTANATFPEDYKFWPINKKVAGHTIYKTGEEPGSEAVAEFLRRICNKNEVCVVYNVRGHTKSLRSDPLEKPLDVTVEIAKGQVEVGYKLENWIRKMTENDCGRCHPLVKKQEI